MPMRSNGKYKDIVKRAKGESTLAREAMARSKRMQEEYVKQMMEKRQRELLAGAALKITQEQIEAERKQRILNLLMGGKKGNIKKFFKAWCMGVERLKQDKKNHERSVAWRRSCRCGEGQQSCFCMALQDPVFQLPFDTFRQTGHAFHDATGFNNRRPSSSSTSMPELRPFDRQSSTMTGPLLPQVMDKRDNTAPPFLEGEVRAVAHHATGRKCFVDDMYRMVFADVRPAANTMSSTSPSKLRMASAIAFESFPIPEHGRNRLAVHMEPKSASVPRRQVGLNFDWG